MASTSPLSAIVGQGVDLLLLVVGVLAALAFMLWKVILPAAKGITVFNEEVVPNIQYMRLLSQLAPVLQVLNEIAGQFRTDSGSTLKDTTNRLEQHARANKTAVEAVKQAAVEFARVNRESITALEIAMGTVRELAKEDRKLAREDRDRARDALEKILALVASARRTEASGARIEADRAVVADELAAQQHRADDVPHGEPPGSAADAASQSEDSGDA